MPEHQCLGTGTKWCCVQTLGTRYVGTFRFNKPSTCPLHLKCANRIMHAFRVQYICLIIAIYGFFTFFMLCFYMKHLRDQMDYDDRRRLAQSRSQSFVPLDQRSENASSGSNHYERTKEITEFWLSGSLRICIYGACLKWLLPELSFSDRWSRGTKLWERDCD